MKNVHYLVICLAFVFLFFQSARCQNNNLDSTNRSSQSITALKMLYQKKYDLDSIRLRKVVRVLKKNRDLRLIILKDSTLSDFEKKEKMHVLSNAKEMQLKSIIGYPMTKKGRHYNKGIDNKDSLM